MCILQIKDIKKANTLSSIPWKEEKFMLSFN